MDYIDAQSMNIDTTLYFIRMLKNQTLRLYSDAFKSMEHECSDSVLIHIERELKMLGSHIDSVGRLVINQYRYSDTITDELIRFYSEFLLDLHEMRTAVINIAALIEKFVRQGACGDGMERHLN